MKCKLCYKEAELKESHIIPKFIFRWMRETSGRSYLRNAGNLNIRKQDGLKEYLFCAECEKKLNIGETYFSNNIFYPYLNNDIKIFQYDETLFYFLISILWRVLLTNNSLLIKSKIQHKELFVEAKKEWREYLLGESSSLRYSNIHLVFTDITISEELPAVNYNRYITRATDGGLLYASRSATVFSKFSKFMVFGKLLEKPDVIWENTKIRNGKGNLDSVQIIIDPQLREYLIERATEIHDMIQKGTSINQKNKIRNWAFNNLDKFGNSELYKVIDADYSSTLSPDVFNRKEIKRNDYCPCGSGKKYKYCHGK